MKWNISDSVLNHVILKKNEKTISSNKTIKHTRIIDYIYDFHSYIINALSPEPFKKILASNEQDIYMIVPNLILLHQKGALLELLNMYYFVELFELSSCFIIDSELKYMFWHMRKAKPSNVRISVCKMEPHPYVDRIWDPEYGRIRLPESYYPRYEEYLSKLNKWMNEGIEPDNSDRYEYFFRTIAYDEFDNRFINPRLYDEGLDDLRKRINRSNCMLLSDIADIIKVSQKLDDNKTYTIDINRKSLYPFEPEFGVVEQYCETQELQAGDLLIWDKRCFLFEKEADFPIFAPANTSIIRLKSDVISPEYLFLYFFEEIGLNILYLYRVEVGNHFKDISIELSNVPVAMPTREKKYYEDVFNKIAYPNKRYYGKIDKECGNSISALLEKKWADCLYIKNSELLKTQMVADIKEIGVCIENSAYKAATLLIGSLLEAYVIDWVSEIDGVDYYQDSKKDYDDDNNIKWYALNDYINYLSEYSKKNYRSLYKEYLKKHKTGVWSDAHNLRIYRNTIHMKAYLEKHEQLNKEKCSMLLGKLESIFEFRRKTLENS